MTEYVKVHGVVLVSTPYKEYDNRIELLTMEYGRITVFIRGARRQGSQSAAASMPFTFAEYELYQGRDAYSFHSANIIRYFDGLAKDFDIMCYASYFSEMARYFSRENVEASAEVNLLYFSFLELEKGVVKSNLIRLIFEYRMLQIQGIGPNVYECVVCTEEKNGMLFDIRRGGLVCPDCIAKNPMLKEDKPFRILGDTVYTLKYILSADIKKLFSFNVSEEVLMDLKRISGDYFRMHVGHTFKSLQFLTED